MSNADNYIGIDRFLTTFKRIKNSFYKKNPVFTFKMRHAIVIHGLFVLKLVFIQRILVIHFWHTRSFTALIPDSITPDMSFCKSAILPYLNNNSIVCKMRGYIFF